jgi:hypothetical protein
MGPYTRWKVRVHINFPLKVRLHHRIFATDSQTPQTPQTLCQSANVPDISTPPFPHKPVYPSDKSKVTNTVWISRAKIGSRIQEEVEKSVTETLLLFIFVCDRVSVGYGKNVTGFVILECVTESLSVNPLQKCDGGNAPYYCHSAQWFLTMRFARQNSFSGVDSWQRNHKITVEIHQREKPSQAV